MCPFFAILLFCLSCIASDSAERKESEMPKQTALKGIHCSPCEGGVAPLNKQQIDEYLQDFSDWKLLENPYKIERIFKFKDFVEAMHFVNEIAKLAEAEGHHPDITIVYNQVTIQLFTHAIQGLSVNDFILAGFIDEF